MSRKLGWFLRIIYNLIRIQLVRCITFGRIKCARIQIISTKAKLRVSDRGKIKIGRKCTIDDNTLIRSTAGNIEIGDNVYINRNCNIISRKHIKIGNGVTIGPNVCVYDHDHSFPPDTNIGFKTEDIIIEDNVWIGANTVIVKGSIIGSNSVIGAGTIVRGNIPMNVKVVERKELIIKKYK